MKQISIGVHKMDSDTESSKQERCDEISNAMKSMLIKICRNKWLMAQAPTKRLVSVFVVVVGRRVGLVVV